MKIYEVKYEFHTFAVAANSKQEAMKLVLHEYADEFDEDKLSDYQQIKSCRVIEKTELRGIVVNKNGTNLSFTEYFKWNTTSRILTVPNDLL